MNRLILSISALVLGGLIGSCTESQSQIREQALKELDIKIEILKKKKDQECRQQAFIEAELFVDSVIHSMLLSPIDDSLYAPPIPTKPKFIQVDSSVFNSQSSVKTVIEN